MTALAPSALVCEFEVEGDPVPQGSFISRTIGKPPNQRTFVVPANDNELRKWRKQVAAAARTSFVLADQVEGAVVLVADFTVERPKSVKREFPSVRPDLDKYVRAICDGITDSEVWKDDGQVVAIHASKVYAERAGVRVRIHELEGITP